MLLGAIGMFVAAAVLYTYLRTPPMSDITNYPSAGTDIIAYGDSLVTGYGATKGRDVFSILSEKIKYPITNLGRSGDTTADALSRVDEINTYSPKIVILMLGGNDYLQKQSMDVAFSNLESIIQKVHATGAVVVLVGLRISPFIGNFESQFSELQKKYKTAYVPNVLDGVFGVEKYMADPIHPNDAGYAIIAERILPVLTEVLK